MIKIWVDDVREAPHDYDITCRSTNQVISVLKALQRIGAGVEVIDLDHDAGDFADDGGDFIKVLDWMVESGYRCPVHLHTYNPVGRENMRRLIKRYGIKEYAYDFN